MAIPPLNISCSKREGGVLIITVTDNGAGIPASEKQHIFDRGVGKIPFLACFSPVKFFQLPGLTSGKPEPKEKEQV